MIKRRDIHSVFLVTLRKQLSNNGALCYNRINLVVIPSYIELPCTKLVFQMRILPEIFLGFHTGSARVLKASSLCGFLVEINASSKYKELFLCFNFFSIRSEIFFTKCTCTKNSKVLKWKFLNGSQTRFFGRVQETSVWYIMTQLNW